MWWWRTTVCFWGELTSTSKGSSPHCLLPLLSAVVGTLYYLERGKENEELRRREEEEEEDKEMEEGRGEMNFTYNRTHSTRRNILSEEGMGEGVRGERVKRGR